MIEAFGRKLFRYWAKAREEDEAQRKRNVKPKAQKVQTVKVVARSKYDAELVYRGKAPGMTVLEAKRGRRVHPPTT